MLGHDAIGAVAVAASTDGGTPAQVGEYVAELQGPVAEAVVVAEIDLLDLAELGVVEP